MTILVPIMLIGWVPITTAFFFMASKPQHAVLLSVIGGWLFLPVMGYDFPGVPEYTKFTAISVGLIVGGRLSGHRASFTFKFSRYDLPMIFWCVAPLISSLSNQLGIYDGISGLLDQIVRWGIPYITGRIYFQTKEDLKTLCLGIIWGGIIYIPLCMWELRMSPNLSSNLYGFFPHAWAQHFRSGGYRPVVFMQHGLMVSLWMAVSTSVIYWFFRSKNLTNIWGLPIWPFCGAIAIITILCKSVNGLFFLLLGCVSYTIYRTKRFKKYLRTLALIPPVYICTRLSNLVAAEDLTRLFDRFIDPERLQSFLVRLHQETLFGLKSLERPFFGWAGYGRGWPIDPVTGERIHAIDSLWVGVFNSFGFFGLISCFVMMLIGPWRLLYNKTGIIGEGSDIDLYQSILILVVVCFTIDCLVNGMINLIYIMISGVLVTISLQTSKKINTK